MAQILMENGIGIGLGSGPTIPPPIASAGRPSCLSVKITSVSGGTLQYESGRDNTRSVNFGTSDANNIPGIIADYYKKISENIMADKYAWNLRKECNSTGKSISVSLDIMAFNGNTINGLCTGNIFPYSHRKVLVIVDGGVPSRVFPNGKRAVVILDDNGRRSINISGLNKCSHNIMIVFIGNGKDRDPFKWSAFDLNFKAN